MIGINTGKTPPWEVRRATASDRDNVIEALTAGFAQDVIISGWLFSDPQTYDTYCRGYFTCYVDFAIEHGSIWTTGDPIGALLAMPFKAWQHTQHDTELKERITEATGPYAERVAVLDKTIIDRHPTSPDHLYLAYVSVTPPYRSHGIGTQMIQAAFEFADQIQLPWYVEASCERNSRLYERMGFSRKGEPISLPDYDGAIYPSWRDPQPPFDLKGQV